MNRVLIVTSVLLLAVTGVAMLSAKEPSRSDAQPLTPEIRERSLDTLRKALKLDEFWPGMHAAEALTLAGHGADVVAALGDRLPNEKDDQRRSGLARELFRAGDRKPLPMLFAILEDEKSTGRVHAAECLYKVNEVGDRKALRAAFAAAENTQLQMMAAAALAQAGDAEALAHIRKQLSAEDAGVRLLAAFALTRVGVDSDVTPLLTAMEAEKDPSAKIFMAGALARLGNAKGREELGRGLDSTETGVRAIAAEYVGHSRSVELQARLVKMLDDAVLDNRVRAAQSLLVLALPAKAASKPNP